MNIFIMCRTVCSVWVGLLSHIKFSMDSIQPIVKGKGKVKISLLQAMEAHRAARG
jgi:hypothetical protein